MYTRQTIFANRLGNLGTGGAQAFQNPAPGPTTVPPTMGDGRYWLVTGVTINLPGGWSKVSLKEMTDPMIGTDSPTGRSGTVYASGNMTPTSGTELKPGTSLEEGVEGSAPADSSGSSGPSFVDVTSGITSLLTPLATAGTQIFAAREAAKMQKRELKAGQAQPASGGQQTIVVPASGPSTGAIVGVVAALGIVGLILVLVLGKNPKASAPASTPSSRKRKKK